MIKGNILYQKERDSIEKELKEIMKIENTTGRTMGISLIIDRLLTQKEAIRQSKIQLKKKYDKDISDLMDMRKNKDE